MTAKLPYMLSTGLLPKILEKVQNARRPDRFTIDFLETKLGHSGGSAKAVIPLLKRLEFLGSDGVPTQLYDQFRNPETQGLAVAQGMRNAFNELFERNEYVYELSQEKLLGQVVEVTGATKEDRVTKAIVGTFAALKELADFDGDGDLVNTNFDTNSQKTADPTPAPPPTTQQHMSESTGVELRVGYTINLNLPETSDPEVFNAIFRSLKENLLKN